MNFLPRDVIKDEIVFRWHQNEYSANIPAQYSDLIPLLGSNLFRGERESHSAWA